MLLRTPQRGALQGSSIGMAVRRLGSYRRRMDLLQLLKLCGATIGAFFLSAKCQAFTQVAISTGAPLGIETQFLAATTAQFNAVITKNPLAANTYSLKIYGLNPSYLSPLKDSDLLNAIVSLSTQTFVYGFADGMSYQTNVVERLDSNFVTNCSTPSLFNLAWTSTDTFDTKTCTDVLMTVLQAMYELNLSTPPVIPPEP